MFPQVSDFRPVAHLWLLYNFFTTYPWHPPTKGSNVVLSLGNNCLHNILFVLWQSQKQLPCPPCNPSISDQIITFHWTICPRQLHMSGGWAAFVQFHRFALLETRQCQILWERRCFRFCFCSIIKKTLPQSGNPTQFQHTVDHVLRERFKKPSYLLGPFGTERKINICLTLQDISELLFYSEFPFIPPVWTFENKSKTTSKSKSTISS